MKNQHTVTKTHSQKRLLATTITTALIGLSIFLSGCDKPNATTTDDTATPQEQAVLNDEATAVTETTQTMPTVAEDTVSEDTANTKSAAELEAEAEALAAADEVVE